VRQAAANGGKSKLKDVVGTRDETKEGPKVLVGDVVLKLGNQKGRIALNEGLHYEQTRKSRVAPAASVQGKESSILVRSYRSKSEDVQWAHNGLVATVVNGEAVPLVQNRIIDAGFGDLVITPMGADKVFLRQAEGGDVRSIVAGAVDFFRHIFSNWIPWDDDGRAYQRGAWIRLYGVPLSAWNVDFFKLCVFECGRFIRADSCSAEKDRLDFARVLIATSDLAIVSKVERVLVDGFQVEIKIVEEWGYAMGEDTCLFEEDSAQESSQTDEEVGQGDQEVRHNVDLLVEKITDVEEDDEGAGVKTPIFGEATAGVCEEDDGRNAEVHSPVRMADLLPLGEGSPAGFSVVGLDDTLEAPGSQASWVSNGQDGVGGKSFLRSSRATSCPPSEVRRGWPGPWSWEWLRDHNHEEAGVIFSASKRARKEDPTGRHTDTLRRKVGGVLRHPVHSLKKLARLPCKDRGEALKALGRCVRRRKAGVQVTSSNFQGDPASTDVSSESGTKDNDWRNWVAVHGNEELALEDVRGIGQSIGVKFRGSQENMFNALTRTAKGKEESVGRLQGAGLRKVKTG
jgi:hypothetical protein